MAFSFWWVGLHVQAWTTVASLAFHPELKMMQCGFAARCLASSRFFRWSVVSVW